jgi:copper chaperone CopZ
MSMPRQRMTLPIDDLSYGGALIVERALTRIDGVIYVYVNPATEMAYIEYDPARTNTDHLVAAVQHVGFRSGMPSFR